MHERDPVEENVTVEENLDLKFACFGICFLVLEALAIILVGKFVWCIIKLF